VSRGNLTRLEALKGALLNGTENERQNALDTVRRLFEATFGYGAKMNNVSLMLCGGAVGPWTGQSTCNCECLYHRLLGVCGCWKEQETRAAILLTGDGDLKTRAKWDSLEGYLDSRRARRTCVFQVAHHGARANWHEGLAALVAPKTSLFSSDPRGSYFHPHAEVLRDFWPYRAVQVDQQAGFSVHVVLER